MGDLYYRVSKKKMDELAKSIEKWPYYQVSSLLNWFEKNLEEIEAPKQRKKKVVSDDNHNS